jgi:hypothetical protein
MAVPLFELQKETTVMSTKSSFPITAAPSRMSIREKMIIAGVLVVFALVYAKGVTLMVDAADTPSAYTTFLHHAD